MLRYEHAVSYSITLEHGLLLHSVVLHSSMLSDVTLCHTYNFRFATWKLTAGSAHATDPAPRPSSAPRRRPGRLAQRHIDTQRHRDTQRHTETHRDTQRHTEIHRDTQRHTETHRDIQRHTETHTHTHTNTQIQTHAATRSFRGAMRAEGEAA